MTTLGVWLGAASKMLKQAGVDEHDARFEADIIAREALTLSQTQLFMSHGRALQAHELNVLERTLLRRAQREPLSQILGEWEFWSLPFKLTADTLTPRPDTEVLVEEVSAWLKGSPLARVGSSLIDIGTGTGCIGLSIAHEHPELSYYLTDISPRALEVARSNVERLREMGALHTSTSIELFEADLLSFSPPPSLITIVSNPPYIKRSVSKDLMPEVAQFEPDLALFGDEPDGLGHVRRIVSQAASVLPSGGALFLEVGYDQTEATELILRHHGFTDIKTRKDYGGQPRVVCGAL